MLLVATVLLVPFVRAAPTPLSFSVTITDTPSTSDPYLITFSATVLSGTPTLYNWSFGDGTPAWTGSSPAYAQPAHRFSGPGVYNVTLTVFEGASSVQQWLLLTLSPSPLHALITANVVSGPVPLTVSFTGVVSGGSSTYRSLTWNFGDGRGSGSGLAVAYTYATVGNYRVTFNVTDSENRSATSQIWINTTSAGGTEPSFLGGLAVAAPVIVTLVAGFAAVVALGLWLGLRRSKRPPARPGAANDFEETVEVPDEAAPLAPPRVERVNPVAGGTPAPPEPPAPPASLPVTGAPPEGPVAEPPGPPPPEAAPAGPPKMHVAPEALRVSQRIVLHLASLGTLGHDEVAPVGFTQVGMSEVLRVRQNALTNVLRRLVAADVITEDTRHVRGQPRRLKVYRLTSRGEALARDLRRAHGATGGGAGRPPRPTDPPD